MCPIAPKHCLFLSSSTSTDLFLVYIIEINKALQKKRTVPGATALCLFAREISNKMDGLLAKQKKSS